jgi:HD-GYP domain-containing protein (c-di-GMP phosphodiesterase class II)
LLIGVSWKRFFESGEMEQRKSRLPVGESTPHADMLHQLSRQAQEISGELLAFQSILKRKRLTLPPEVLEAVNELCMGLTASREQISVMEEEFQSLQALAKIGYVINSSLDLTLVLNEVMDTIIQLTGAERAFLMLRNAVGDMEIVIARNWEHEVLAREEQAISSTIVNEVVEQGEAVLTFNAREDPRFGSMHSIVAHNFRSILCVPLKVKENLIGVIYADNKAREGIFNEQDRTLLTAFANQAAVALENAQLFNDLSISYGQTLDALVSALDVRDHETEGHTRRVVLYSLRLARKLGLPEDAQMDLRRGAMMHDIGKLGIPDSILLKPGPLTDEEWKLMRRHPAIAEGMLEGIPFFRGAIEIIATHHERYDGSGYPRGLAGEEIPLGARIFAVADAFDAITSRRPYREAQPYNVAREEIRKGRGTQFDPEVVDAFLTIDEKEWQGLRAITLPRARERKFVSA